MNGSAFHSFVDYMDDPRPMPGIIVPQRVWVPPPGQQSWQPLAPIKFSTRGRPGVRLTDALHPPVHGLDDARTIPSLGAGAIRQSLRIQWPGYDTWNGQNTVNVYDHGVQVNPRDKEHIAYQVAKAVQAFYREMAYNRGSLPDWELSRVPFGNLYLIEIRKVSQGSWQPVFCFET